MRMDSVVPVRLANIHSQAIFKIFRMGGGKYLYQKPTGQTESSANNCHAAVWDETNQSWYSTVDNETTVWRVRGNLLDGFIFSGEIFVGIFTSNGWEAIGGHQTVHGHLSTLLRRGRVGSFVVWDFGPQPVEDNAVSVKGNSTGISLQIHDAYFIRYPENDDYLPSGTRVLATRINGNWVIVGYDCYISGHG